MSEITFELVTLEGAKFSEQCYSVQLPTPDGLVSILPHHIPLVSIATPGVIAIRRRKDDPDSSLEHFASDGGLIEVTAKRVRLLADAAESADDIDEFKVKAAMERAQELKKTAKDQVALADATALIERHSARLKVAELKKRRTRV